MAIWNDTTAANVTVTVYGYWDNAAVPKNDEIWMEVSYMGSSATPIATINTSECEGRLSGDRSGPRQPIRPHGAAATRRRASPCASRYPARSRP